MKCIEVAHLYAHEKWDSIQQKSFDIGKKLSTDKDRLVCLIDNYNSTHRFTEQIPSLLAVYFEKDLVNFSDEMLGLINQNSIHMKKMKGKEVYFYKDGQHNIALWEKNEQGIKFYCVFLCLIWYSCRAGLIKNPWFNQKPDEIINVLDSKFQSIEEKVQHLIKSNKINIIVSAIYV